MFNGKIIFVTWWTWTWWQAIIKYLLVNYDIKKIIVFSRNEDKQVLMEKDINSKKLTFILWDIRNKEQLLKFSKWVDYVIHLAALKHIYKCSENSDEAISINIVWTQNLIDVCIENKIKKCLYISTDKAVEPYNLYWNTKAIWEKIIIWANSYSYNNWICKFFVLRAWNIIWSNWSVFRIFANQIKSGVPITITNIDMKRFYVKISDVVKLIELSFKITKWWEIFVLKWKVLSLKEVLDLVIDIFKLKNYKTIKIWSKTWEKKDEVLISSKEIENTFDYKWKYFIISDNSYYNKNLKKVDFISYSTDFDIDYWTLEEIKDELLIIFNK